MRKQRSLLEAEGVDLAEEAGVDVGGDQPQLPFDFVGQCHVASAVLVSERFCDLPDPVPMFLGRWGRHHRGRLGCFAIEVRSEVVHEHVANDLGASRRECILGRYGKAETGLDQIEEFLFGLFLPDARVGFFIGEPPRDQGLALRASKECMQDGSRQASRRPVGEMRRCRCS